MLPDPVAQSLFHHSQAACCRRLALARLNKPRRLLLEFKRVTSPLRLRHLRYPFALEEFAVIEAGRGNDGLWEARKTMVLFSALPTNLGNRGSRFPHSHRRESGKASGRER